MSPLNSLYSIILGPEVSFGFGALRLGIGPEKSRC